LVAVLLLQNMIVVFSGITGGEIGLTVPDVISIDADTNYWIALGFMAFAGLVLTAIARSPVGLILQAAGQDPQAARDAAVAAVKALFTGDPSQKAQAEARAAEALAKAQNIPVDQAKTQIQTYEKQYTEAVATAKQKAEAAAVVAKSAATQGAFYGALALILGALAG
ncbi:hypothetical protein ACTXGI_12585, partial [Psychrobacter sp. T6-2]|uniref:hypothetical protein n=1 Tax=Psychrobacter sp. T6-2 TaxID=3457448 RepID=UPI003FD0FC1A